MKKLIASTLVLGSLFLASHSAIAGCSADLPNKLTENLKDKIPLVEMTPNGSFDSSCQLTVKYRPCKTPIVTMLRTALLQTASPCTIENSGTHKHVEDYCLRENVTFSCNAVK